MHQGVLPFQCEVETTETTSRAGLLPYLDLLAALELRELADRRVAVRRTSDQGWTDGQIVQSLILLNLAGGDSVDDLARLENDQGLGAALREAEQYGLRWAERRALARRRRKGRQRTIPSASAVRRYLEAFHDEAQEQLREPHKAFIPAPNAPLRGLSAVNAGLLAKAQAWSPQRVATLDQDATLVESGKAEARYCYQHYKAYQPLNTYWAEQGVVVHSEFRDGNVPAGYQQLRVLQEALAQLPAGVEEVFLRSDSAGYQWELLKYCAEGKNERFGVIEFAVSSDVDAAFKKAVDEVREDEWRPLGREFEGVKLETGQEWAEVCFVPNEAARKKDGPEYRFLAIREPLRQLDLPGLEEQQRDLPFPTMEYGDGRRYKLFGVVTNRNLPGDEVLWWLRERCGKSEEVHDMMKRDLAGGKLPAGRFGANAAWWAIMILALNVQAVMRRVVLGGAWATRRLKAFRFGFINVVGRVVRHARRWLVKLAGDGVAARWIIAARERIRALAFGPSG